MHQGGKRFESRRVPRPTSAGATQDDVLDAEPRKLPEVLQQGVTTACRDVEVAARHRLLDLPMIATELAAVLAKHLQLAGQVLVEAVRTVEQVAGVGVPGDQTQRPALTPAADQDRWVRSLQRVGGVERPVETVVAAHVRALVALPHPERDLQRLLQLIEPLAEGEEGDAQASRLMPLDQAGLA
jgi:hypothetical protein